MVLWGMLMAGGAIYVTNAQMTWTKEYTIRVQSGYYNPKEQNDAPKQPWALWAILGAMYGGAVVWSLTARPFVPSAPPAGFEVITPSPPAGPRD